MRDCYDFSKGRKNPYADQIKRNGYSVTIHYSPKNISDGHFDDTKDIIQALVELMSDSDAKLLLEYIKNNFNLQCSADIWNGAEN